MTKGAFAVRLSPVKDSYGNLADVDSNKPSRKTIDETVRVQFYSLNKTMGEDTVVKWYNATFCD